VILVIAEGKAEISANGTSFGPLGTRMDVFEQTPPASVYAPNDQTWNAVALTACTIGVCTAPGHGGHKAQVLPTPERVTRGKGGNTRYIFPIAMEESDVADSLLVTEVFTEDRSLDETMSPTNHDVVLVPKGHHPCAAPYGYEMYYLIVMAGPRRNWRFENHPDHDWIAQRDA